MDTKEFEEITQIRKLLERIAASEATGQSKSLFEAARSYYQTGNFALSVSALEAVREIADPFYTANALLFLSEIYKRLQNSTKETEIYKAISTLPAEIKRFVDPVNLGVIHGRLGDFDKAVEYYKRARELNGETPSTQANLAELLLVHGELQEAATLAEQLASRPEAKYLLIGRILKGACLWFLGKHEAAAAEFHWVGHYLISSGSIPADFTWDFRDSQPVLDRIELRAAQLVVQVLDKKISFDEFRTRWLEVEPTAA